jgi:hypothetical protein
MPPLTLQIHGIEDLIAEIAVVHGAAVLDQAIRQRRLAVVDVGDDAEGTDVLQSLSAPARHYTDGAGRENPVARSDLSSAAEPVARAVLMQATQRLRQFHRIGRSATTACRNNLERAHREGLAGLRNHLADQAASGRAGTLDREDAHRAIQQELAVFHQRFLDAFGAPLQAMEGWDPSVLQTVLADEQAAVDDTLGQFQSWNDLALPSLDVLASTQGRRRAGFLLEEAYRCLEAGAHTAAAVFCARALEEVQSDPAAATFQIQTDATTRALSDVEGLLNRSEPVERESVLRLWNLLATTCSVMAEANAESTE